MKKLFAMFMALAICLSMIPAAFAASPADAVIDVERLCSIDLYKYDLTSAEADGVWDNSYVSTGTYDKPGVNDILGNPNRVVDLGNGEVSYGYAIKGVEFTYARVADIYQYVGRTQDGTLVAKVLYGFDNMELLSALGLTRENRFAPADHDGKLYFTADTLLTALRSALETNATGTKNALESIVKTSGTAMPETDSYGHSEAKNLPVGLYLVVETRVPEMVTETTAPFLLSLPMTTVDGTQWMYDVCVYPKNGTSNPDLTKTVRESKESTGKNGGTGMIDDGFDHTATASVGDVVEYQILSRLPAITSKASYLTTYTFEDTICKGILYNRNDVVLEFFRDAACTDKIAIWNEGDGNFGVGYVTNEDGTSVMTITMQENGLKEINQSTAVHAGTHESDYSQCYLRITYSATLTEDAVPGNTSNDNEVVLTWKRTNTEYYDTLKDCCHVYVYGVDLEKQFSDEEGNFEKVQFTVCNDTDKYYVTAELKDGIYYVTGTAEEANATRFVPNEDGHIRIRGIHDTVIDFCIDNDLLYEDKRYHSAVFLGRDSAGMIRYAGIRSTGSAYKGEASGSDKHYSFRLPGRSDTVHVFESAIDALSYATLMLYQGQNWHEDHLLSLAGVFKTKRDDVVPVALQQYLKEHPQIRTIRLHLDNDAIGRGAVAGIVRGLQNRYQIVDEPPVSGKDVNDFLMHKIHMKQEVTR